MGLIETYVNLKSYDSYDIAAYELQKEEARECVQALEKMIPKKARVDARGEATISGRCPVCETDLVLVKGYSPTFKSFCRNCGQRLDWSE